ncbi:MAG TPA: O-antigen ligase family protein [Ottowia sp.]|uniref:O-antigen ligase family protein n=1 Tax=Ottowia sp. TaxID=1898956 RepID=UPI002BC6899A|nr:O-antigen ligase family protein [Ottowia sp.]HMN20912.1 O-antigen ligase family protein [Ottowia sp.]
MLALLLVLAPLVRGGNREVALSVLLALALALLALLLGQAMQQRLAPGAAAMARPPAWWWVAVGVLAASPAWLGLLQLVPLPLHWWSALAGRQDYLEALRAGGVAAPARLPLSLNPWATWASVWSGVPLAAAFVAALRLPRAQIDRLMALLLGVGALQVVLAVAQFAGGRQSPLYFGLPGQGFVGSFANRNHLADLLAMLLPVWFYAWLRLRRGGDGEARGRLHGAARPLLLLLGFGLLVVLLSTQSRGGILASLVVLLLAGGLQLRYQGAGLRRWQRWALVALFGVFVALALASIDLRGLASRLEQGRLQSDAEVRHTMAAATWQAAGALWPWGSGLGTFESVFPRYQPPATPVYVNHAHNDYAQMAMELGAPALLLVGLALALALRQLVLLARALRAERRLSSELALRCLAGLGVLALLLHSWVEFNMHIPALAIVASFLAGVYLRPLEAGEGRLEARTDASRRRVREVGVQHGGGWIR